MNKLFIISGMSASGKTTIIRSIMRNEIISTTTRNPRSGERDGVDYLFVTRQDFLNTLNNDGFLEHSEYRGNYYGISSNDFYGKLNEDHAFSILDVHGKRKIQEIYPNTVTIFIYADRIDCIQNAKDRGETESFIFNRLSNQQYLEELENKHEYDYVIKNKRGSIYNSINIVKNIIEMEKNY